MPSFSQHSAEKLATCDKRLQALFNEVIKHEDCIILEGHRGKEAQNAAYAAGKSKLKWPKGNHNSLPSKAVDVAPFPVDWNNIDRFKHFAAFVMATAKSQGLTLRWGGDWDSNPATPNKFNDFVHFEIR